MEWQPIETAPKDGTKVDLLYPYPRGRTIDCWWENEGPLAGFWLQRNRPKWKNGELLPEGEWDIATLPNMQPTHWMPSPPLPPSGSA